MSMGYSIAAPIRSYKQRDKMIALLDKKYRKWPELVGQPKENSYLRGPRIDDLSYHHGKCYIGYDYNAGGAEREYGFCIVRYIAIKIGRKCDGLPYYIYDGDETTPLLVNGKHQTNGANVVDQWGVPLQTKDSHKIKGIWERLYEMMVYEEPHALDIIRDEIKRLDALWEKLP